MDDMLRYIKNCSDIELTLVATAIQERRRKDRDHTIQERQATLKVGDRIQIGSTVKPRYLAGTPGTIKGRKNGKFIVHLDEGCDQRAVARFGRAPVCPASILEPLKEG